MPLPATFTTRKTPATKDLTAFSPSYLIHGHIHLYDANDQRITAVQNSGRKKTFVINAYSHIILNLFAPVENLIGESNV